MLPSYAARRRGLPGASFFTLVAGVPEAVIQGAVDQPAGGLVAAQVPVLRVAEHDGDDDLGLLGGGVAHEPRVLHVERLGPVQRAGLAGDVDRLVPAKRSRGTAELAG